MNICVCASVCVSIFAESAGVYARMCSKNAKLTYTHTVLLAIISGGLWVDP